MGELGNTGERSLALFLFALLAFNPPLLSVFSSDVFIFGVPLLYLYLFCGWGLIIALIAANIAAAGKEASRKQGKAPGKPEILGSDDRGHF